MIESQSIGGIPENITYFYRDDNLESTRGTRFQVNPINSRIWVADVVSSKAPKTFGDRQVKGAFIRRRTHLELGPRGHYIMQRGFGYTPELVERQTLLVLGNAQLQQCRLESQSEGRRGSGEVYGVYNWRRWVLVYYGPPGHVIIGVSGP